MQDKLQRYYEIKTKIRALEFEASELQPEIIDFIALGEFEKNELEAPFGTFKLKSATKWKYSDELIEQEKLVKEKIKIKKKDEELKGVATKEQDGFSLVFLFNKGV